MTCSEMTAAVAKDLKQDKKATTTPNVSATQMTDSEMEKVTAGVSVANGHVTMSIIPNGKNTVGLINTPGTVQCIGAVRCR